MNRTGGILLTGCMMISMVGCDSKTNTYEIAYGTNTTIAKVLGKEEKDVKKTSMELDSHTVGRYIIDVYNQKNEQDEVTIHVQDTKAPSLTLHKEKLTYKKNETIAYKDNVKEAKDEVDGNIKNFKEVDKKEFEKLLKEFHDKQVSLDKREFHNKEELSKAKKEYKKLTDYHCVYITSDVNTKKEGSYQVSLAAVDKNYNVSKASYTIEIKGEKKEAQKKKEDNKKEEEEAKNVENATIKATSKQQKEFEKSHATPAVNNPIATAALSYIGGTMGCDQLVYQAVLDSGVIQGENTYRVPFIPMNSWASLSTQVSRSNARAGDILYYQDGGLGCSHVAIYLGNGQAVHGGFHGNQVVRYSIDLGSGPIFYRLSQPLTYRQVAIAVMGQDYIDIVDKRNQNKNDTPQQGGNTTPSTPSKPDQQTEEPTPPAPTIPDQQQNSTTNTYYEYELTTNGKRIVANCPKDIDSYIQQYMSGSMSEESFIAAITAEGCHVS